MDPRVLLAGCDDGALRVVSVLPNAVAATVTAAHGPSAPPIERVRAGGDATGSTVATVAAACREVRVWDGGALFGAGQSVPRGGAAPSASAATVARGRGRPPFLQTCCES